MRCKKCRKELNDTMKFCSNCGEEVKTLDETVQHNNYPQYPNVVNQNGGYGYNQLPPKKTNTALVVIIVIVGLCFTVVPVVASFIFAFSDFGDFFEYEDYNSLYGEWVATENNSLVINQNGTFYSYDNNMNKEDDYCTGTYYLTDGVTYSSGYELKDESNRYLYTLVACADKCVKDSETKMYGYNEYCINYALAKEYGEDKMDVQEINTNNRFTARKYGRYNTD